MTAKTLVRLSKAASRRLIDAARWTRTLVLNLDRHHVLSAASAMAFDMFLSLIPVLAMAGFVLQRLHEGESLVVDPLIRSAPSEIQTLAAAEFMRLSDVDLATLAPVSIIGFLWVSSSGLSTAMSHCEIMLGARPRSWLRRRAIAIVCVIAGLLAIGAVAASAVLVAGAFGSIGATVVSFTLPGAVLLGGLWAFFRVATRKPLEKRRRAMPGALVTLLLWSVVTFGFSEYVREFARYATFYGSLAAVAILLFWLWLLMLALLLGAEVNAVLEGSRGSATATPWPARPAPQAPSGVQP